MKKWITIPAVLIGLLLLVPGLIGAWLPGQIQPSLENSWPDATAIIQRGWFSTSMTAQSSTSRLNLDVQHLPWWHSAWLTGQGELIMTEPETEIALDGRLSLTGHLVLNANTTGLRWNSIEENRIERLQIAMVRQRGQNTELIANVAAMVFSDALGNRIDLQDTQLVSQWVRVSETRREWTLGIDTYRPNHLQSHLRLNATSIEADGMANLMASLAELSRAEPNSMQARMAGLGMLDAWQQLVQAGLIFELNELNLDRQIQLQGRWRPAENELNMSGGGPIANAMDWMAPMFGLNQGLSRQQARQQAWSVLANAEQQNHLCIANERFEWTLTGANAP